MESERWRTTDGGGSVGSDDVLVEVTKIVLWGGSGGRSGWCWLSVIFISLVSSGSGGLDD